MRFTTLAALSLFAFAAGAHAALPPPSDGEKAKAAEAKAKTDWEAKHQAYLLCKAQDRAVAEYRTDMEKAGKPTKPSSAPGKPCADPGPYAAAPGANPPLEASGAHSPARTATAPPSTNQHAAEQDKAQAPAAAASKP